MSVGIFGSKRLASIDFNDVDILYAYSPNMETLGDIQLKPLFNNITNNEFKKMIGADGLFKLRLPSNVFNSLGFYTVVVKPKAFQVEVVDCTFIVTNDNDQIQISKKGIVIPALQFQKTGALIGYMVEYFDNNSEKIKNFHRIVTSSDLVSVASAGSGANSDTYVLDPNGTRLFITLTPDEESLISNSQKVDLGKKNQKILISNTFFDPEVIEIEMVDQNIKTLSYALYGNSTRDLELGVYSIFDENNSLYKQYNLYTRKKQFSNGNVDVKEIRTNINQDNNFINLSQGI